jgi:hypothetical protein
MATERSAAVYAWRMRFPSNYGGTIGDLEQWWNMRRCSDEIVTCRGCHRRDFVSRKPLTLTVSNLLDGQHKSKLSSHNPVAAC